MLLGEMQFIDNGQVLSLANVKSVFCVNISNRKFYPFNNSEFAEELYSTGTFNLRVRYRGSVAEHGKKGAYGTSSSTSSITPYSSISGDNRQYDLTVESTVLVTLNYFYYLTDITGKYTLIKNVKTFTKLFPEHKTQIETFVKEHSIHFNNSEDLKTLLEYCGNLTK
jgi:hypothetical protein